MRLTSNTLKTQYKNSWFKSHPSIYYAIWFNSHMACNPWYCPTRHRYDTSCFRLSLLVFHDWVRKRLLGVKNKHRLKISALGDLWSIQGVCQWVVLWIAGSQTGQARDMLAHAGHRTQCWHGVSTTDDTGCLHTAQCSDRSLDNIWSTDTTTFNKSLTNIHVSIQTCSCWYNLTHELMLPRLLVNCLCWLHQLINFKQPLKTVISGQYWLR